MAVYTGQVDVWMQWVERAKVVLLEAKMWAVLS